ncbi:hypothetical protein GCM10010149_18790 [Nonomuraea roseoviolacea subsp. roseoviolacea]
MGSVATGPAPQQPSGGAVADGTGSTAGAPGGAAARAGEVASAVAANAHTAATPVRRLTADMVLLREGSAELAESGGKGEDRHLPAGPLTV